MIPMSRRKGRFRSILWAALLLAVPPSLARVKVAKLAEQLLYGDQPTRNAAVIAFNKLPAEAQERLVPDFMVALSDDNPEVRKIASRILKAMGVKSEDQVPDAQKALPAVSSKTATDDKWADLKKMKGEESGPATQQAGPSARSVADGHYADMKQQIDLEKKGQVSLDASQLQSDANPVSSPLSTVIDSLKDPDPWVRAQAARRLAMIHPAPMEAIPTLIKMLGDKETESRRAAVAALGSFGHLAKDAVLPLNSALSDPDPAVRTLAAEALKQIQQPQ
jgi:HEAT repeat protein